MDKTTAHKRVLELRALLNQANDAYYDQAQPFMSDQRYDVLLKELQALEKSYGLEDPNSPLYQAREMLVDAAMENNNFDWRNTIGHELGHSISMPRVKSLNREGLIFDNNDPNAYSIQDAKLKQNMTI